MFLKYDWRDAGREDMLSERERERERERETGEQVCVCGKMHC